MPRKKNKPSRRERKLNKKLNAIYNAIAFADPLMSERVVDELVGWAKCCSEVGTGMFSFHPPVEQQRKRELNRQ